MSLLHIRSSQPETVRRGRLIAIILLGLGCATGFLLIMNLLDTTMRRWVITDLIFLGLLSGLFAANRYGWVQATSLLLVLITVAIPFTALDQNKLVELYIVMVVPVLLASFTLISWSGIVVAAALLGGTLIVLNPPYPIVGMLTLAVISAIAYLFAASIERVNRQQRQQAQVLAETNQALAQTGDEQKTLLLQQEQLLSDQQRLLATVQDLSATVLQVADQVLLCPLIGTLTKARMQEITASVLAAVSARRASRLIIDVTGQQDVANDIVELLLAMVQAARLLGCEVVLTGISAELAPTLARRQRGLGQIQTVSSLQQGLELALTRR